MSIVSYFKKSKLSLLAIILIIVMGAFFRLYHIREYITFLGDEGRDVLVVKRIIVDHKLTLLGPITSVGSMYMGPIYYYFMVPFLWLWNFDPVGPAIMVVFFSLSTTFLVYLLGKEFFNSFIGIIAAFLYAISPLSIIFGRSSWNPNIVPFFSLLTIFSLLKIIVQRKYRWFIVLGLCLGVLFQLHYVTFLFIFVVPACLSLIKFRVPIRNYIICLISFIISYSPFLIFELRHGFVNLLAVWNFISEQKKSSALDIFKMWSIVNDVLVRLFWRLVIVENAELTKLFLLVLLLCIIWFWKRNKKLKEKILALKVILLWFTVGIFSFILYQGVIYDYYFGSLWMSPFILTAITLFVLFYYSKLTKVLSLAIFSLLIFYNFNHSPLRSPPSNLLENTKKIARFVYDKTEGKPYNFALIAGKNSDHAYRYFLELWGRPPVVIENPANDPGRKTVTERLFVVCEEKICQPLGHPLWEIAGFGMAQIVEEWSVVTAKVFYLEHLPKDN